MRKNCVVSCAADGLIVEIDSDMLHDMLQEADKYVKGLRDVREKCAHYQSLAMLCENAYCYHLALTQLRKALKLYCRSDRRETTPRNVRDAKYVAEWIERLSRIVHDGDASDNLLRNVTRYYELMYWINMEDSVYDKYDKEGRVPFINYNEWRYLARQLCA